MAGRSTGLEDTKGRGGPRTRPDAERVDHLVRQHRAELRAHCRRMLGCPHDAEDALQETLVRAWRGLPRFEGRSTPRSWLLRIATNACLDTIARRRRTALPLPDGPAAEQDALPDDGRSRPDARLEQRERLELALAGALGPLPPRQRAALALCDLVGFTAGEAAEALDTTVVAVHSALQRARHTRARSHPPARPASDPALRRLVPRLVDALDRDDVPAVVLLLTGEGAAAA